MIVRLAFSRQTCGLNTFYDALFHLGDLPTSIIPTVISLMGFGCDYRGCRSDLQEQSLLATKCFYNYHFTLVYFLLPQLFLLVSNQTSHYGLLYPTPTFPSVRAQCT